MEIDSGLDSKGKGRGKDDSKTNIAKTAKNEPETRVSRAQAEWDKAQQVFVYPLFLGIYDITL
jgi:hypothetical protein